MYNCSIEERTLNKLVFPKIPTHFHLKNAVLSTFDLDENLLVNSIKEEDIEKYLIIRGDGEYISLEDKSHPIKDRIVKVFFESTNKKISNSKLQSVKYHHPKIWLFIYENEQKESIAKFIIQSENIYSYNSKEIAISFLGHKVKETQIKNEPLIDYYNSILSFLNDDQKPFIQSIIEEICHLSFKIEDYKVDDFDFISPSCQDISLLNNEYDEILIIAPFINVEPIKNLLTKKKEGGRCIILTQPSIIESLIISDVKDIQFISPEISDKFIHSKIYLLRKGNSWDMYAGSMNLSSYAIEKNIEAMVHLKGVKGIKDIESFLANFLDVDISVIKNNLSQYSSEYNNKNYSPTFLDALKVETRINYIKKLLVNKKHDEEHIHQITSYLLSSRCISNLIDLFEYKNRPIPTRNETIRHNKKRFVYRLPFNTNILMGLINYSLHQYDYLFSKNVYLHIANRSIISAFIKIHEIKDLENYYLFKTDIHDFDASMNKELLNEKIDTLLDFDKPLATFLKSIINEKRFYVGDKLESDEIIHQTGLPLAGFFENAFLYDFDYAFEKAPLYIRCGDDILVASKDKNEIEEYASSIIKMIESRKLLVSEAKTKIYKPGEELVYLGWEIKDGKIDFSKATLKRVSETVKDKTKTLLIMYGKKKTPNILRLPTVIKYVNYFQKTDFFIDSFQIITTTEGLKKIDEEIINLIRVVISGKTGNSKYKLKYKSIQDFGYKSLVNQYYEFISKK